MVLRAGEAGVPPVAHKGVETVLVASGLGQLQVTDDTRVMRTGDALLAADVAIRGWPSILSGFWVLRTDATAVSDTYR